MRLKEPILLNIERRVHLWNTATESEMSEGQRMFYSTTNFLRVGKTKYNLPNQLFRRDNIIVPYAVSDKCHIERFRVTMYLSTRGDSSRTGFNFVF